MEYVDFSFNISAYNKCEEYTGTNAVILAIKNILLSRPGNYPFTPDLGMDIAKYQFELLDDYTISNIKTELLQQIGKFIPTVDNVSIDVRKVESEIQGELITALGINVSAMDNGESITSNLLVLKDKEIISVYNEVI